MGCPGAAEAPRRKAEALPPVTSVGDQALEVRSPQHGGHLSQMAHAPGDRIVLERRGYEAGMPKGSHTQWQARDPVLRYRAQTETPEVAP